jgi:hypothetical protein
MKELKRLHIIIEQETLEKRLLELLSILREDIEVTVELRRPTELTQASLESCSRDKLKIEVVV